MSPLRTAAFGAGWVTINRHIPTMRADGGFDLRALVDRRPDRAQGEAARLELPALVADRVSALPIADELDAITCGTAPFSRLELVGDALRAGKHVLTEKPFAMSPDEGRDMVRLAAEHGRTLGVVHNFQFASSAVKVRRWLRSGRLGAVKAVWGVQLSNPKRRLPEWVEDLPLGLFYDESPHLFYLVDAFAPAPLTPLSAVVHPSTLGLVTPAHIDVQLRAGNVPVMLQMSFEAPLSEWHVTILGERGLAAIDVFRDIAVFAPNDGAHGGTEVIRTSASLTAHHWLSHIKAGTAHVRGKLRYGNDEVFRRFRTAAQTGAPLEAIDGADALRVLELQHWVVEQAERTRLPAPPVK